MTLMKRASRIIIDMKLDLGFNKPWLEYVAVHPFPGPAKFISYSNFHFITSCVLKSSTFPALMLRGGYDWFYVDLKKKKRDILTCPNMSAVSKLTLAVKLLRSKQTNLIKNSVRDWAVWPRKASWNWLISFKYFADPWAISFPCCHHIHTRLRCHYKARQTWIIIQHIWSSRLVLAFKYKPCTHYQNKDIRLSDKAD